MDRPRLASIIYSSDLRRVNKIIYFGQNCVLCVNIDLLRINLQAAVGKVSQKRIAHYFLTVPGMSIFTNYAFRITHDHKEFFSTPAAINRVFKPHFKPTARKNFLIMLLEI